MNNDKVIAPGMFRISPDKVSREAKKVPNTVSASSRTKPITVSQPSVITKKGMNSNSNGFSSTGLDNTKTRRPQPRSNTKNDRVPSASKSSRSINKDVKVEEHHRNLPLSKKTKHSSSACNNSKIDSLDVISKVVCAICKKCLISVNHDECLVNYVRGKKSRGKLVTPSGDNACTSNTMEPKSNGFQILLLCLAGCSKHMTGNLKLLINFIWKFMGTARFGNDHVAAILEAARTMLIFSRAPLFLWAEAIATACFTQNRSIIHRRFNKTPYELINGRKPDISFLYVFGALCYPKNNREDIRKIGAKGDIGFFIRYSADSCAYRIYNRRTK
nr:retrovirus-related Pol polyprotein from transposon TNT 1-94 [Tanacetum cinerariifolium]